MAERVARGHVPDPAPPLACAELARSRPTPRPWASGLCHRRSAGRSCSHIVRLLAQRSDAPLLLPLQSPPRHRHIAAPTLGHPAQEPAKAPGLSAPRFLTQSQQTASHPLTWPSGHPSFPGLPAPCLSLCNILPVWQPPKQVFSVFECLSQAGPTFGPSLQLQPLLPC